MQNDPATKTLIRFVALRYTLDVADPKNMTLSHQKTIAIKINGIEKTFDVEPRQRRQRPGFPQSQIGNLK